MEQPAGNKTRDSKLWFLTMGGLAMIDPAKVKANTRGPPSLLKASSAGEKNNR